MLQPDSTTQQVLFFVTLASFFLWAFIGLESATISIATLLAILAWV